MSKTQRTYNKETLILQFKHSYVESLREETYDDWNDMLIQQKNEYYSSLFWKKFKKGSKRICYAYKYNIRS